MRDAEPGDQELIALSDAGFHELELETVRRSGGAVAQSAGMLHLPAPMTHPSS